MNALAFSYSGLPIRTAGTPDAPLFVAADVCRVLELSNVTMAVARLDSDEVISIEVTDSTGRSQLTLCVTESGLYSLILGSRKPQARDFKRWITHEVLPAIRKTGGYQLAPTPALPANYTEAVRALLAKCEENDQLALAVADMAPKAAFADAVQFGVADMNIGTFAKIIGVKHLFQWLRDNRYLYYRDGHNVPYAQYDQNGQNLFRVRMVPKGDHVYPCTSITGKGQLHIAAKLGVTPALPVESSNIVAMLA